MLTTEIATNVGTQEAGDTSDTVSDSVGAERDAEESKIPVRNWWHMLLYAWDLVDLSGLFDAKWERAPDLRALLTQILAELTNRQIRRGLRGDYVDRSEALKTGRGGIDFNRTLSDLLLYKGQLHCEYQEYSLNVPRNQIIATTLQRQMRRGFEKINDDRRREVIVDVERLVRMMANIDDVGLSRSLIATEMRKLGANEREYKLMLRICEMLYEPRMPQESENEGGESFRNWIRDRRNEIFESFVANFYTLRLSGRGWRVSTQLTQRWHVTSDDDENSLGLPIMRPDIVLTSIDQSKRIIIDTKWYGSVTSGYFGSMTVHSANLYQMYAYLASQDQESDAHRKATGILLYGQTREGERKLRTRIDEHPFWVETLDLMQEDWEEIEGDLLRLVDETVGDG